MLCAQFRRGVLRSVVAGVNMKPSRVVAGKDMVQHEVFKAQVGLATPMRAAQECKPNRDIIGPIGRNIITRTPDDRAALRFCNLNAVRLANKKSKYGVNTSG